MANLLNAQQKYREAIEESQSAIAVGPNRNRFLLTWPWSRAKSVARYLALCERPNVWNGFY
jgi:hypothetical protein